MRGCLGTLGMFVFWLLRIIAGLAMILAVVNLVLFWNWAGAWQWFAVSIAFGIAQFVWGWLMGWALLRSEAEIGEGAY